MLISAFGLLLGRVPGARLVIAGPTQPSESERWHALANQVGAAGRVEIPGHVDEERYSELLRAADLAVQLRLVSNGEASAAVADCLAAGLPTIVSDLGWASELPEAAVEKVPTDVQSHLLHERMLRLLIDEPRARLDERSRNRHTPAVRAFLELRTPISLHWGWVEPRHGVSQVVVCWGALA